MNATGCCASAVFRRFELDAHPANKPAIGSRPSTGTTPPIERYRRLRPTRLDVGLAILSGGLAFLVYARTVSPDLLNGDSGEFQVLAYLLGNTHPTGYQVYVLLAKLATWLPLGSIAQRVNLFSGWMAALAVAGVYLAGRMLAGQRWAALLGAAALAVSPTLWSQAVIAEVYTPGAAFLAWILAAVLYWDLSGRRWALFLGGLLGGLSLGVHLTVALLAPAVGAFLLLESIRRREQRFLVWRSALLGAAAGAALAVGAFFFLDWLDSPADFIDIAVMPSRSVWGLSAADLDTSLERLAYSLSARQWRGRMFADPWQVMNQHIGDYLGLYLPGEFSALTLILAVLGGRDLLLRHRRWALLILGALLCQWVYAFNYDIHDIYVFYIPSYLLLALLVACGASRLGDGWRWLRQRGVPLRRGWWDWPAAVLLVGAIALGCLWPVLAPRWSAVRYGLVPLFEFGSYPVDFTNPDEIHRQATLAVRKLEPQAIVFANWRLLYPYCYAAYIEQGRTDLVFLEEKPHREGKQSESSLLEYVAAHRDDHPIYFSQCLNDLTRAGYRCQDVYLGLVKMVRVQFGE